MKAFEFSESYTKILGQTSRVEHLKQNNPPVENNGVCDSIFSGGT